MGTRFRKSFKIAPGVKLNINKKSIGLSAGVKGARVSVNSKGRVTKTVGIPGTGLSYTDRNVIAVNRNRFTLFEWYFEIVLRCLRHITYHS